MKIINQLSVLVLVGLLAGCQLSPKGKVPSSAVAGPRPMTPQAPVFPGAEKLVIWHAEQCGLVLPVQDKRRYAGQAELRRFFASLCISGAEQPGAQLAELDKMLARHPWPASSRAYFSLLRGQLAHLAKAKAEQMNAQREIVNAEREIKQTLSALATLEQELLQRAMKELK